MKTLYKAIPKKINMIYPLRHWFPGKENKYHAAFSSTQDFINKDVLDKVIEKTKELDNTPPKITKYNNCYTYNTFWEDGHEVLNVLDGENTYNYSLTIDTYKDNSNNSIFSYKVTKESGIYEERTSEVLMEKKLIISSSDDEANALADLYNYLGTFGGFTLMSSYTIKDKFHKLFGIKASTKEAYVEEFENARASFLKYLASKNMYRNVEFSIPFTLHEIFRSNLYASSNATRNWSQFLVKYLQRYKRDGEKLGSNLSLLLEIRSLTDKDLREPPKKLCEILMIKAPTLASIYTDFYLNEEEYMLRALMSMITDYGL